ncbi:hypothetical protein JQC92_15035 [Shewanella sp. 202IG2-18]|uniref:hypothetical protein n=1 Tax=Parashewanella hymeniacidonis TaxID=2807618 RepID=UPI00195F25E9|nr:hypothetical protein [Parashewanella hymeniacidonis]MBM7073328.1 hypothetical protein [Parashewanella hymeniacidonis]
MCTPDVVTPSNAVQVLWGLDSTVSEDNTTGGFIITSNGTGWNVTPDDNRKLAVTGLFSLIKRAIIEFMNPIKTYQIKQSLNTADIRPDNIINRKNTPLKALIEKAYASHTSRDFTPIANSGTSHDGKNICPTYYCPMTGKALTAENAIKVNLKSALQQNSTPSDLWVAMTKEGLSKMIIAGECHYQFKNCRLIPNRFNGNAKLHVSPQDIGVDDISGIQKNDYHDTDTSDVSGHNRAGTDKPDTVKLASRMMNRYHVQVAHQ